MSRDLFHDIEWNQRIDKLIYEMEKRCLLNDDVISYRNILIASIPMKEQFFYSCRRREGWFNVRMIKLPLDMTVRKVECSITELDGKVSTLIRTFPVRIRGVLSGEKRAKSQLIEDPTECCEIYYVLDGQSI